MAIRADAHLHFFRPGYVASLPPDCRRIQPDEVTLYHALAQQHGVERVLAVGFEGEPWAYGNNRYLADLTATHTWISPVAFVQDLSRPDIVALENWRREGFVGLSLYLFTEPDISALMRVPDAVWQWLVRQHWLISVNSRGEHWTAWAQVLQRHPDLCLLVSHLGLPRAVTEPPEMSLARSELRPVRALARFQGVHVKLSGFYALTTPGYAYPHQAAWPYVEVLLEDFGASRLLWGSDFAPSLEWLSFPQTFGLFTQLPFLNESDRLLIEGQNLVALLARCSA